MSNVFKFKQFSINQTDAPFKVGTDGVLLGAWCGKELQGATSILDIGTGTGLIALMLAQRFTSSKVEGLEINDSAGYVANNNFHDSPWKKRLTLFNTSLQNFQSKKQYDLIVCNPPFFIDSLKSGNSDKDTARHTIDLNLNSILHFATINLAILGVLSLVIPFDQKEELLKLASNFKLNLSQFCAIYPTPTSKPKRILVEFKKEKCSSKSEELIIEEFGRHQYSEAYKELTRDFYLKF